MTSGLGSALLAMMFTSVTWLAKSGVVVGSLLGAALAYLMIARVLRAQGSAPQRASVRRLAAACCLIWALVLPLSFGAAGLLWGLAHGLGEVVEGPVSTTVRATTQSWLARANGLRAGVLGRFPLAKRLSDGELMAVVRAAPEWMAEALDHHDVAEAWKKASSVTLPPQVLGFVSSEFQALTGERASRLRAELDRLRSRAQGALADRPTLEESINALVAPAVFQDAARQISATAGHFVRVLVLGALALSAALAGMLRLLWKRPASGAPNVSGPTGEGAHG
jgi:hypothetical protein